jgi:hypothetical protein
MQPMPMPSVSEFQASMAQSTNRGQGIPTYFTNNIPNTPSQNTVGLGIKTSNGFHTGIQMQSSSPIPTTHGAPTAPMYSTAPMNTTNSSVFPQQSSHPSAQWSSEPNPQVAHLGSKRSASEISAVAETSSPPGKRMKRGGIDTRNGPASKFE